MTAPHLPLSAADLAAEAKMQDAAVLAGHLRGEIGRGCPVVVLTQPEIERAVITGCRRNYASLMAGHTPRGGIDRSKESFWGFHIEGAGAEMAVAKLLGVEWSASVNTFRTEPDVTVRGTGFEVRLNTRAPDLRIRPHDSPELAMIAVYGIIPKFFVVGYCTSNDHLRQPQFLTDPGRRGAPCWAVPYVLLNDVTALCTSAKGASAVAIPAET